MSTRRLQLALLGIVVLLGVVAALAGDESRKSDPGSGGASVDQDSVSSSRSEDPSWLQLQPWSGAALSVNAWRLDRNRPLSSEAPTFTPVDHALSPPSQWRGFSGPKPTNSFWGNLAVDAGDQPVNLLPYVVRVRKDRLIISAPKLSTGERAVVSSADEDLEIRGRGAQSWNIRSFDDFAVTLEWRDGDRSLMSAPLVRGAPFISMRMDRAVAEISPGRGRVLISCDAPVAPAGRALLRFNNGQAWAIYGPPGTTWKEEAGVLVSAAPVTGFIRVALAVDTAALEHLDAHASAIPVGGTMEAAIDGETAFVQFAWKKEGDGPLMMMALPHHLSRIHDRLLPVTSPRTIRGTMTAVEGDTWHMHYSLKPIGWASSRPVKPERVAEIRSALAKDAAATTYSGAANENAYFGGKELARTARLITIARELGDENVIRDLAKSLLPHVESWLDATGPAPLVYDRTWGGVASNRGILDRHADFGAGYYNDHHFHYGYILHAAAVLADLDPVWGAAHRESILSLARDITNPSAADGHFPSFRHMDWFEGHSWAAGLFSFGDNRNQESVSEAVNAWYACQLAGAALKHIDLENIGRLAAAVEAVSAREYYFVMPESEIYGEPFRGFGVVGILWSTKVDATTFFGAQPEFVYGIQMLPITPASELYLDPAWIAARRGKILEIARTAPPEWRGFLLLGAGVTDPDSIWKEVAGLPVFDGGNSLTNSLHWLATRP
ncbi:MAG: glycosyl hydrolase [Candidatus Hydrogenedentota bacterium]